MKFLYVFFVSHNIALFTLYSNNFVFEQLNMFLCSYQNPEPWHIRVDMAEWGPELHMPTWRSAFDRRGANKTNDSNAQVRMCVRKIKQVYA